MKSQITLENYDQARLLATEGMGLFSVSGIRLALRALKFRETNDWPIEVTMSAKGLGRAVENMTSEADRLEAFRLNPSIDPTDSPDFPGNELSLRATIEDLTSQIEIA